MLCTTIIVAGAMIIVAQMTASWEDAALHELDRVVTLLEQEDAGLQGLEIPRSGIPYLNAQGRAFVCTVTYDPTQIVKVVYYGHNFFLNKEGEIVPTAMRSVARLDARGKKSVMNTLVNR